MNTTTTSDPQQNTTAPVPLTFGQRAVGLTFNPGNNLEVDRCKRIFAQAIDQMNDLRTAASAVGEAGIARHASVAITMIEDAQMRAVKAITWRD